MNLENTAERLAGLASLLYAGCGLPAWCFDKEGGLYFTTSAYGKELGMFLEIGGCKEFAMTKGTEHDRPFVMSDALGMVWVGEFVELTEDIGRTLVLMGPAFYSETSLQVIREGMQKEDISLAVRNTGRKILSYIPILPMPILNQYIRMFHFAATSQMIQPDEYIYQSDLEEEVFQSGIREKAMEQNFLDYENSYALERLIMQCVREGNMAYENIVGDNYLQKPPRNYMTGDSLREAKDILIIFTSQCCNAAIEGKMSIKAAKELEAAFIHKIEKSRTVTQLTGLRHQIMQEYISKVHELRLVSEISRPIRLCCDYVNAHFMEPMKLGDIAKEVGYTEYYLTRKFQREMGERLWDYVRNVRLDYAKILLISTECTVQEISERCQFGSRNYFTRMFRAREGASPKEYRERARNLDLPGDGTWVKMNKEEVGNGIKSGICGVRGGPAAGGGNHHVQENVWGIWALLQRKDFFADL